MSLDGEYLVGIGASEFGSDTEDLWDEGEF